MKSSIRSSKSSYHTNLKFAVNHGLFPDLVKVPIPRSTISDMRRKDPSHHVGYEFQEIISQMELLKDLSRSQAALRTASAVLRLVHLLRGLNVGWQSLAKI